MKCLCRVLIAPVTELRGNTVYERPGRSLEPCCRLFALETHSHSFFKGDYRGRRSPRHVAKVTEFGPHSVCYFLRFYGIRISGVSLVHRPSHAHETAGKTT